MMIAHNLEGVSPISDGESTRQYTVRKPGRVRKIVIVGSGAVGKTTLVAALRGELQELSKIQDWAQYRRTLFLDLQTLRVPGDGPQSPLVVLQFVDMSGQLDSPIHPLRDAVPLAVGQADVVMLVFASNNTQSLIDLRHWISILETQRSQLQQSSRPTYVLVRTKTDLPFEADPRLVDALRQGAGISYYFETSCVTMDGIDELRRWLCSLSDPETSQGGSQQ